MGCRRFLCWVVQYCFEEMCPRILVFAMNLCCSHCFPYSRRLQELGRLLEREEQVLHTQDKSGFRCGVTYATDTRILDNNSQLQDFVACVLGYPPLQLSWDRARRLRWLCYIVAQLRFYNNGTFTPMPAYYQCMYIDICQLEVGATTRSNS
ncbi:hypothetical protein BT96DRAFT_544221 [Gymnopus androsaceus JB14]|uniref:Uncharacterized protein n=1 Tax=Gymnopus androsaceus JB14 TaxID=1447944 RepID=A0A6A4HWP4_9AGAR|nr:hypothetical protein BT96DRAFT_544221 [Gymnopus androsaceus JB14]